MDEVQPTPELVVVPEPALPASPTAPSLLRRIFFNECELRAGWRFLLFVILLRVVSVCASFLIRHLLKLPPGSDQDLSLRPGQTIASEGTSLLLLLGVTAVMARPEKRKLRYYGLPLRQAFRANFWKGCIWGFVAISALLLVLRADHNFYYGTPELSGWSILQFALLWGIAFVMVGLFEEFLLRGYAQFTLTLGIGFWPAAFLLSLYFAFLHRANPGETAVGLFEIVLIALFFCFTLWRTGNLWFAVGFHAAWDWSQSFFYGTPDSGLIAQGRLLRCSFAGPAWLTGGSAGPEGSVLVAPLILLLFLLFHLAYPKRAPYPDPEAIKLAQPALIPPPTLGT